MLMHNTIKVSPILALAAVLFVAGGCSSQRQSAALQLQPAPTQSQVNAANNNRGTTNYCKNVHWGDEFAAD